VCVRINSRVILVFPFGITYLLFWVSRFWQIHKLFEYLKKLSQKPNSYAEETLLGSLNQQNSETTSWAELGKAKLSWYWDWAEKGKTIGVIVLSLARHSSSSRRKHQRKTQQQWKTWVQQNENHQKNQQTIQRGKFCSNNLIKWWQLVMRTNLRIQPISEIVNKNNSLVRPKIYI